MDTTDDQSKLWTIERILLVATFIMSTLAFVFGLGVQWARTTRLEAELEAVPRTYVRTDVYTADRQRLSESIDRLTRALDAFALLERQKQ